MLRDEIGTVNGVAAIIRDETDAHRERLDLEARLRERTA
jgi:hypothetical protein